MLTASLDPTFGRGGAVVGPADSGSGSVLSGVVALAVQLDGKIVAAGSDSQGAVVRRFNANGSVDISFGTGGQAKIPLPAGETSIFIGADGLAIGPDGSIVVAATTDRAATTGPYRAEGGLVARLTPAGQLDTSFGTGGEFVLPANDLVSAVAVQADGKVVAVGSRFLPAATGQGQPLFSQSQVLAIRLTTAGTFDSTFNGSGELVFGLIGSGAPGNSFATVGTAVAIAPTGQIYAAAGRDTLGTVDGGTAGMVARIKTDGTLDGTYGAGGILASDVTNQIATITALAVQPDGKVLVASRVTGYTGPYTPALVRLLPDGTVDPSFQGLAFQATTVAGSTDVIRGIAVGGDGIITAAGTSAASGLYVEQFTAAGRLDTTLGANGQFAVLPNPPAISGSLGRSLAGGSVALTPAGKIIVGGTLTDRIPGTNLPPGSTYANAYRSVLAEVVTGTNVAHAVPGDYDGDGRSDVAAELAALGQFAYRPSSGMPDVVQGFGQGAIGKTIPMAGDFDGDGRADVAAYLPALGQFAYRPSSGGRDVIASFSPSADRAADLIPAPGDYDGTGRAQVAAYDPYTGSFLIRSAGGTNRVVRFGRAGFNESVPAPGDYDGDGKTDLAVYMPGQGIYAYRPSSGGADVLQSFGQVGGYRTVPAASVPYAQFVFIPPVPVTTAASAMATQASAAFIPLTEGLTDPPSVKKKAASPA